MNSSNQPKGASGSRRSKSKDRSGNRRHKRSSSHETCTSVETLPPESVKNIYNRSTLMDNWREETCLNEYQLSFKAHTQFMEATLTQKARLMYKYLFANADITKDCKLVRYGYSYQIFNSDLPNLIKPELEPLKITHGIYLVPTVSPWQLPIIPILADGCQFFGSPDNIPCKRNTYMFEAVDGDKTGEPVLYGEELLIRLQGFEQPFYVQSKYQNISEINSSHHNIIQVSTTHDRECRWKLVPQKPEDRQLLQGKEIIPNTKVLFYNSGVGKYLAAEYPHWVPNLYGLECTVSCHNFRDSHKMERAENYWEIRSRRRPDRKMLLDAAMGREEFSMDVLLEM